MIPDKAYFFCGVGGSGMTPLALILRAHGLRVDGSDRALDQGRTSARFDFLRARGIGLHKQDGSGLTDGDQVLVASAAVEEDVPDVVAARRLGARRISRAQLLAALFNEAPLGIGVAGTSGKSTTTAMIGWILHRLGEAPTIVNGAEMKNFITPDIPFASAVAGSGEAFVSEVDESDGSIALFRPAIAVVNNITLDHKPMDELRTLFGDFAAKARTAVLNLDDPETAALAAAMGSAHVITYSLSNGEADLVASDIRPEPDAIGFDVDHIHRERARVRLAAPGLHNVSNALAALGAAIACGLPLAGAAHALGDFSGVRRRMEVVGTGGGVTVIDDFAHNPDKIAATLAALHAFPGRLLVMFQPHGYGPLRLMKDGLIACFAEGLAADDVLVMPAPVYFGGTTDRSVGSENIAEGVRERGREAVALADRAACGDRLMALARPGDRLVVMGARDDTLSQFAAELLSRLG